MKDVMENKRPILVTILCILSFIGLALGFVFTIPLIFSPNYLSQISPLFSDLVPPLWYNIFSLLISVSFLVGYIYIWKMKKIGLYIYTVTLIIGNIVAFSLGFGSLMGLILTVVLFILFWMNFKKMS